MRRVPGLGLVMTIVAAWALLMPPLDAQPRVGSFTTVTTTDTTANSLLVGCTVGSTSCSGGIKAGPFAGTTISGTTGALSSTLNVSGASTLAALSATTGTFSSTLGVTGAFTGTTADLSSAIPVFQFIETDAAANSQRWRMFANASQFLFDIANDAQSVTTPIVNLVRSGTSITSFLVQTPITFSASATSAAAVRRTGAIAPVALASGSTNNYNPTGLSDASYLIITADAGGSTLTGLTAQTAGTEITICEPTPGAGSLTIASESGSSTAANRFNLGSGGNITLNKDTAGGVSGPCATFWYYGTGARWLLRSTSTSVP